MKILSMVFPFILLPLLCAAQEEIVDQVVAVVGDNIVLQSDVENQVLQIRSQGALTPRNQLRCEVLEDLLAQKLLLNQAQVDSIEVTSSQVEMDLDRRLQMFISQVGSAENLEAYYNKSILEIKDDFRELVRDQLLTEQMQREIAGELTITPSEVKSFYNSIPPDSLPLINSQIMISQIVKNPPFREQTKFEVREKLLNLRKRIIEGESFVTLAVLYSEDVGSAPKGGELGFRNRSDFVQEFADAAFSLKENTVSPIVETEFGFHIIQLIARRGDQINVRHILMRPKIQPEEILEAKNFLDSLANLVRNDSLSFEMAARYFSEDELSSVNGGIVINPITGNTKFEMEQLHPSVVQAIRDLKIGEISESFQSVDESGNTVFKIVKIKSRSNPHPANLKEDYAILHDMAKAEKQQEEFLEWIMDKQKTTYIKVNPPFRTCNFASEGWLK